MLLCIQSSKTKTRNKKEKEMTERLHNEDPLAGDVDRWVHPDETRTDEQIAHDEKYAVEPYDDYDNSGHQPEDFEKPATNVFLLNLEKAVKEHAVAQGMSEDDAKKLNSVTFLLNDAEGNPSDTLQVTLSSYKGMYNRPGVQGFYVAPLHGEKDEWDRDKKFVRGSFWGGESPENPEDSSFSMSYGGGPTEDVRDYAKAAMGAERLAQAELVELEVPQQA
jgi:hypothetical protein